MASQKDAIYASYETKLKDIDVTLKIGSGINRLSVGDIILHNKSSEEDRAVMKACLMKHPKSAVVDTFLNLLIHARGQKANKKG
jgi:hypothetical protein